MEEVVNKDVGNSDEIADQLVQTAQPAQLVKHVALDAIFLAVKNPCFRSSRIAIVYLD
jgi:hypothetical protein